MTENEAIELFKERLGLIKEDYPEEVKDYEEVLEIGIEAIEMVQKLSDRKMTTEVLENYMQFEDECIKKGFTFKSVIEAREKQIAKKPIRRTEWENFKCPACGSAEIVQYDTEYRKYDKECKFEYCSDCGQKLDWSDEE